MAEIIVGERTTYARLVGLEDRLPELQLHLAYSDKRASYELGRFVNNDYNRRLFPGADYGAKVEALKAKVKCSLLVRDESGLWVPAGVAEDLAKKLGVPFRDEVPRPGELALPWVLKPDKVLRPYQEEAVRLLIEKRHGAVEIACGLGKTLIALQIVKELGLPAVICSPFTAIAMQTYKWFLQALGPKRVGLFGNGKKDITKDITIATTQSLHRATGAAADFFRKKVVVLADEAQSCAADTLKIVFLELLGAAPYRFFMSGTVLRTDGLQLLLDGIVGSPVVLTMDALKGQSQGYLAKMPVRILEINNGWTPQSSDAGVATREALFESQRVNRLVGELVNRMVESGRPTLIMIDELPQFAELIPFIKHEFGFAHSTADRDRLKKSAVPVDYWKPDVMQLVEDFNAGRFPILIGTSAIGTGVDIRVTGCGVFLRGGTSEIDVRQVAGRFMRLHPGKTDCLVFDVDILDGGSVHRHAKAREKVWRTISHDVMRIKVK